MTVYECMTSTVPFLAALATVHFVQSCASRNANSAQCGTIQNGQPLGFRLGTGSIRSRTPQPRSRPAIVRHRALESHSLLRSQHDHPDRHDHYVTRANHLRRPRSRAFESAIARTLPIAARAPTMPSRNHPWLTRDRHGNSRHRAHRLVVKNCPKSAVDQVPATTLRALPESGGRLMSSTSSCRVEVAVFA
jgi:hypothetical protein